jgi:hypothetical protein
MQKTGTGGGGETPSLIIAVTRSQVRGRARELALLSGRSPHQVSQVDYERAKRELTGETDLRRQEARLNALPEINPAHPALA